MRPIPPEILAVYLGHPDAPIPERPWWRIVDLRWVRSDGAWGPPMAPIGAHPYGPAVIAALEAIDGEIPASHPGFRVGQVWAWIGPDGAGAGVVLRATAHAGTMRYGPLLVTARGVDIGGAILPAWLLADPCCPWLAPWGPPCAG